MQATARFYASTPEASCSLFLDGLVDIASLCLSGTSVPAFYISPNIRIHATRSGTIPRLHPSSSPSAPVGPSAVSRPVPCPITLPIQRWDQHMGLTCARATAGFLCDNPRIRARPFRSKKDQNIPPTLTRKLWPRPFGTHAPCGPGKLPAVYASFKLPSSPASNT